MLCANVFHFTWKRLNVGTCLNRKIPVFPKDLLNSLLVLFRANRRVEL